MQLGIRFADAQRLAPDASIVKDVAAVGTSEVLIRWMRLQAWIVDRPAHREVVEHLETVVREPEDPVCEVVEEAADAGAADPACFGFEA